MSGGDTYLRELIARAVSPTLVVRPRPRHRFEAGQQVLGAIPPALEHGEPGTAVVGASADPPGADNTMIDVPTVRPANAHQRSPAKRGTPRSPATLDASVSTERLPRLPRVGDVAATLPAARVRDGLDAAPQSRQSSPDRRPRHDDALDDDVPAADVARSSSEAWLPSDRASRRRASSPDGRQSTPTGAPHGETVHVTIGRIEIRAVPEKAPAAPRDDGSGKVLAAYLREHARGHR